MLGKGDAAAHLRPTADRVRESLFNLLSTAATAIRSPARGCSTSSPAPARWGSRRCRAARPQVTFVDDGRTARALIRRNIDADRAPGRDRLSAATRPGWARRAAFDLVFLDPPYGKGLGERALAAALAGGWIAPGALVVWEDTAPPTLRRAAPADRRRYGDTWITLARYAGQP